MNIITIFMIVLVFQRRYKFTIKDLGPSISVDRLKTEAKPWHTRLNQVKQQIHRAGYLADES
jgi:hypothetical protein